MRADRLLQLAEYLESDRIRIGFDLSTWAMRAPTEKCGAVACIAGHAVIVSCGGDTDALSLQGVPVGVSRFGYLWVGEKEIPKPSIQSRAQEWLGLTDKEARLLFVPTTVRRPAVTVAEAALACRALAYGGRQRLDEHWCSVGRAQVERGVL